MKKILTFLAVLAASTISAQTAGQYKVFRKSAGVGDSTRYVTPVNNSLFSLNANGMMTFLAQSNFANASHTHLSVDVTDATTGGNGSSDAGKLAEYGAEGQLRGSVNNSSTAAIVGTSSGTGYAGFFNSGSNSGEAVKIVMGGTATALLSQNSGGGLGADIESTGQALSVHASYTGSGTPDIAKFSTGLSEVDKLTVKFDGGLEWGSTGAQTTATNLPAFGTSTKGVVPASGGGTSNFLRADGSWASPSATVAASDVSNDSSVPGANVATALNALLTTDGLHDGSISTLITSLGLLETEVANKAPIASPTFTGTPAAPTAAANTNTTQIATTAYVQSELSALGTVATARTGAALAFDVPAVYNTAASPSASSVTVDWTGAVTGTSVKAWFNHSTEPTWPAGITVAGVWDPSAANSCTFTYHGSSTASGECVSDATGSYTDPRVTYFPNVAGVPTDWATSVTTEAQVAGLSGVPIKAGKLYSIELVLRGSCSSTGGMRFGFFFDTGTDHILRMAGRQEVTADSYCSITPGSGYNAVNTTHTWWPNSAVNNTGYLRGTIRGGAVDGVMEIRARSVTSGQTSTIYADGSYMTITQLN